VKIEPQNPHEKDCLITTSASQIAEGFNKFLYDKDRKKNAWLGMDS
jgi:hypothetical protein